MRSVTHTITSHVTERCDWPQLLPPVFSGGGGRNLGSLCLGRPDPGRVGGSPRNQTCPKQFGVTVLSRLSALSSPPSRATCCSTSYAVRTVPLARRYRTQTWNHAPYVPAAVTPVAKNELVLAPAVSAHLAPQLVERGGQEEAVVAVFAELRQLQRRKRQVVAQTFHLGAAYGATPSAAQPAQNAARVVRVSARHKRDGVRFARPVAFLRIRHNLQTHGARGFRRRRLALFSDRRRLRLAHVSTSAWLASTHPRAHPFSAASFLRVRASLPQSLR